MEPSGPLTADRIADILRNLPSFVWPHIELGPLIEEAQHTRHSIEAVDFPRLYQVETTSRCNLRCPFCPRTIDLLGSGKRDLKQDMPLHGFRNILDQMPWVTSLELFHFGEPFIHRDLHEYVKLCKAAGIYVVIASNLLPANEKLIDRVFDAGLDFLVMDIDSLDPERYAAARVGGSLDRLQPIVRYILQHPDRPYTVAQTIQLDGKREYTPEQLSEWIGDAPMPDEVRYKFLDSFRGSVTDKGGLGPEDICREAFYGMTVHVNGNVVVCDRDWAGDNVMGNVFEDTVLDIWNGEKYAAFRAAMKSTEKPEMCRNCPEGRLFNARSQQAVQVNMFRGEEVE